MSSYFGGGERTPIDSFETVLMLGRRGGLDG